MAFLLDTNVVSELARPRPDENAMAWLRERAASDLYLCAPTFGELIRGAEKIADTAKGRRLVHWIEELGDQFAGRILTFDLRAARHWGSLMGTNDRSGRTLPAADAQIAAIAAVHGLTLVTRNVRDFERMTDAILDPFLPRPA